MTKQEIAVKLREAVKLMNDKGAHWVKGEYIEVIDEFEQPDGTVRQEYGFCSLGAIRHVTQAPVEHPSLESDEVAFALAQVLPPARNEGMGASDDYRERSAVYDRIVTWNDDGARQWSEVVEKFEEAARRLEA